MKPKNNQIERLLHKIYCSGKAIQHRQSIAKTKSKKKQSFILLGYEKLFIFT